MYSKVLETIEKYNMLKKGDKIIAGLSGGADSCSLVHILSRLGDEYDLDITAVHINHGIRGSEADRDEAFAKEFCERLEIKFIAYHCDIPKEAAIRAMGEEETGRLIRYEKFTEAADNIGGAKIAVAHNENDMTETLIMNLCRGTGLKGLAGIRPVNENIIRPILYCSRPEIEQYCRDNDIEFCTDSTNLETEYTRNKVRQILLPWLEKEINFSAGVNIAKTAALLREEEDYLENLAEKLYSEVVIRSENNSLVIKADILMNENPVMRRRVLRIALRNFRKDLKDYSRIHAENADDILMGKTGRRINLPGNVIIEKSYDSLNISLKSSKAIKMFEYIIPIGEKVFVREINRFIYLSVNEEKNLTAGFSNICTKTADYDKINGEIKLRTRCAGDTIGIKNGRKKLKDLLIDEKVPAQKRDTVPVLACGNKIILVENRLGEDFYIGSKTKKVLYIYIWEEA